MFCFNMERVRKIWKIATNRKLIGLFLSERHGVPVAFVGHGKVEWVNQEGVSDLSTVWTNHGGELRYVVMKEKEGYCLYDFDTAFINRKMNRIEINPPEIFPTEESAVMAATLQS